MPHWDPSGGSLADARDLGMVGAARGGCRMHMTQGLSGSWVVAFDGDLAAQSQTTDHCPVAVHVVADQVRQKASALADELQQTAA